MVELQHLQNANILIEEKKKAANSSKAFSVSVVIWDHCPYQPRHLEIQQKCRVSVSSPDLLDQIL